MKMLHVHGDAEPFQLLVVWFGSFFVHKVGRRFNEIGSAIRTSDRCAGALRCPEA